jgi:chromosome partitioning protein
MAVKVSVVNMKGGVGKTTIAVNLAWYFAEAAEPLRRVLVVDLDPQFNASQYLLGQEGYHSWVYIRQKATIWTILEEGIPSPSGAVRIDDPRQAICKVATLDAGGQLDLVPARLELALSLRAPMNKEQKLARFIGKIEEDYDLIVIDCAPTESVLTIAAYLASDYVLLPVQADYFSSLGLPLLADSVNDFKQNNHSHNLEIAGIVFNNLRYEDNDSEYKAEVQRVARNYDWFVFETEIPYSKSIQRSVEKHLPFFHASHVRSKSKAVFEAFAERFAERIGL